MSRKNPRFHRINATLPLNTGNVYQVSILGQIENQLTVNNFYFEDNGTPLIATQESDLAVPFQATFVPIFAQSCSNEWQATALRVAVLSSPSRIPLMKTSGFPFAGIGGVGHLPTTVAAVINRQTSIRGQSGRGRIYVPAVPLPYVTSPNESTLNAAGVTALTNLANAMLVSVIGANRTYQTALVSRRGTTPQSVTWPTALLIATNARPLLGTIRRRRIGRGK